MLEQTIKYADLVDVASLQSLMDSLNQVIGIANAIIDTEGVVITESGWQDTCVKFHRVNAETCANCIESDTSLAKSMFKGESFAVYRCLNGLVDTAMPIVVDGQHVANVFTGQFFSEQPDPVFFREQARRYGFDETAYLAAVSRVPIVPKQRIETITRMYAQLAQMFAANGLARLSQQKIAAELASLNSELTLRVQQRTAELSRKNQQLSQEKQALADSEARLTALFENMSSGVAVYRATDDGKDFIVTGFNQAAERIEKINRDEVIGKRAVEVFPGIIEFGLFEVLVRVNNSGEPEALPTAFYQDERVGGWRDNYCYKLPSGEIVAIYEDATERKKLQDELERQARVDYLTGLFNRRHFMELSELELARALRYNNPLSVFMIDIDFFKKVNDTYGHKVGDFVLQKLSQVCRETLREIDIVGRLGGEEFVILLPETDGDRAAEVAERLRDAIAHTRVALESGLPLHFTVSIGVATLSGADVNLDMFLNQADEALYRAKGTGRNRVCVAFDD